MMNRPAVYNSLLLLILSAAPLLSDETVDHSMEQVASVATPELGGSLWFQVAKIFFAMASLLVIMILASYLIKQLTHARHLQMNRSHSIKVVEQRALDPKTTLYIIKAHSKSFLVASSSGQIQPIGEVPSVEEEKDETSPTP